MKKRILSMIIILALIGSLTVTSFAETQIEAQPIVEEVIPATETVEGDKIKVSIYGEIKDFNNEAQFIDGFYFVPLREMCDFVGTVCSWDQTTGKTVVTSVDGTYNVHFAKDSSIAEARDRFVPMEAYTKMIGNSMYVPARSFAKLVGLSYWIDETCDKILFSHGEPLKSADEFYNADDLKWLSRIIQSEARGESFSGKLAVGNVVMNRVKNPKFPNTIYKVVFAPGQFTPARTGAIYNTPNKDSVKAAKLALEGYNIVPGSVYFVNERKSTSNWFRRSCVLVSVIGNHTFYK